MFTDSLYGQMFVKTWPSHLYMGLPQTAQTGFSMTQYEMHDDIYLVMLVQKNLGDLHKALTFISPKTCEINWNAGQL